MSGLQWLKSSFSDSGGNNCVELAAPAPHTIALRESDDPATVMTTDRTALRALLRAAQTGAPAVRRS
ncbi:DUF397 domain-containing protein [Streptomyces sp. NBC_01465]|nr:DUF397 domain-containing protein [Streptomyces sp. NBC_01465]